MGYDVSYHPITEEEIKKWYFDVLEKPALIDELGKEYNIDPFYIDKYKETIQVALKTGMSDEFDTTHGYYIAVIQGFFRKYFYTRGSAFSFLLEENADFLQYRTEWKTIIPKKYKNPVVDRINQNYSSGVYISPEKVTKLLNAFKENFTIQKELMEFYSYGRIKVFVNALTYCNENKMGLLEATEVIEPNPFDLNKSSCYSNLYNCDKEGLLLYREAALEQIREAKQNKNLSDEEIDSRVSYKKISTEEAKENKSFWKKLFTKE